MYKLTIEAKGYNRCVFEFNNIEELSVFLETALRNSVDGDTKVIVEKVKEGVAEDETL